MPNFMRRLSKMASSCEALNFQTSEDVLTFQVWIAVKQILDRVTGAEEAEHRLHRYACASDHRASIANVGVGGNALVHNLRLG